jgi:hypothetical protein|nr:MAG TPA_asm: hypothetical protein [Bacteriophage sp.]DAT27279.1 MAG TPA: hypothetical protein [Caudoviricetes sp.]
MPVIFVKLDSLNLTPYNVVRIWFVTFNANGPIPVLPVM